MSNSNAPGCSQLISKWLTASSKTLGLAPSSSCPASYKYSSLLAISFSTLSSWTRVAQLSVRPNSSFRCPTLTLFNSTIALSQACESLPKTLLWECQDARFSFKTALLLKTKALLEALSECHPWASSLFSTHILLGIQPSQVVWYTSKVLPLWRSKIRILNEIRPLTLEESSSSLKKADL